mmetsp:Transcript_113813/g.368282  ORF Transcript_113813/g.368282 Transcript_113813/m.368282 type:complete len:945 (-) Transcript_113813:117-2951(-)
MAGTRARPGEVAMQLKPEWTGFDLIRMGTQAHAAASRGDLLILSGCITTTAPTKLIDGFAVTVAHLDHRCVPARDVLFLAPTASSRSERLGQCGTSMMLRSDGSLQIQFGKSKVPMVLHFSGFCCCLSREEPTVLDVVPYSAGQQAADAPPVLQANVACPLALQRCGDIVCLQGELKEAVFGPGSRIIGVLPPHLRPRRELRFLASLLREAEQDQRVLEQTVALNLRPDGKMLVQGGREFKLDKRGQMGVQQQSKKGRLCLDGLRFALHAGMPLEPCERLRGGDIGPVVSAGKSKISYLVDSNEARNTAVCICQGDIVMLEGRLFWSSKGQADATQQIATLPDRCWPPCRQVFFTRSSNDLEERCRVDIDQWGRIFCPEGVPDGRLELTGIIFLASAVPSDASSSPTSDTDDILFPWHGGAPLGRPTSCEQPQDMLDDFIRRCNVHEWKLLEFDLTRSCSSRLALPRGGEPLRGSSDDPTNLCFARFKNLWHTYKDALTQSEGIASFQTLLHVSDELFEDIARRISMHADDVKYLVLCRRREGHRWDSKRQIRFTFEELDGLAEEIADRMFTRWDFEGQLRATLRNESLPQTVQHLQPPRDRFDWVKRKLPEHELPKFTEIQQFFSLYETNGSDMTHSSFVGSRDAFTRTGKWFFPDSPEVQQELFQNIAWLFMRHIMLVMTEKSTTLFPFIEDLDFQAPLDWQGPGSTPQPPDHLIIEKPKRGLDGAVCGDPGELLRERACAIHKLYPYFTHLEAIVYSASGFNKRKNMLKSSFHLVWPQLIVDSDHAMVIRLVTLDLFSRESAVPGSYLQLKNKELMDIHDSNGWDGFFDKTTVGGNGLRLPYNDKGSINVEPGGFKRTVFEKRPNRAIGRIRFDFETDASTGAGRVASAQWVEDVKSHSIFEWISRGSCRRGPGQAKLTPWKPLAEVVALLPPSLATLLLR